LPPRLRDRVQLLRFPGQRDERLATARDVRACYRLLLGRKPDERGFLDYVHTVASRPTPIDELVASFVASAEFRDRLHRTLASATGAPRPVDLPAGFRLYVRPDDAEVGGALRREHRYEENITRHLTRALSPGSVFVDVGASIGFYTVLAGRLVGPSGRVMAFEPGPQNHSILLLNLLINDLGNVELFRIALSDTPGVLLYSRSGGNGAIDEYDGEPDRLAVADLVDARPLDEVIDPHLQVDVMKVDVEGAEGRVFRGAEQTLRRCRPTVFFEFSPTTLQARSGMDGTEMLSFLSDIGYRFEALASDGIVVSAASAQGLLETFDKNVVGHLDVVARPASRYSPGPGA